MKKEKKKEIYEMTPQVDFLTDLGPAISLQNVVDNEKVKQASSLLNQLSKQHQKAKEILNEASHDFALLKAILKYEKKTTTRPEEIYLENVKKRLDENLKKLSEIYGKDQIQNINQSWDMCYIKIDDLRSFINQHYPIDLNHKSTISGNEIMRWLLVNRIKV